MGDEVAGTVTVGGQKVNVKGDFASDHVTFSGGRRGEVAYKLIDVVSTAKGILRLRVDGLIMEFPLGQKVDRLANKIRKPPSLMDKLGVKEGVRVATTGAVPRALENELGKTATIPRTGGTVDLLFFGVRDVAALDGLAAARSRIGDTGGVWVIYPKGKRDIRESDVLAAGRAAGLKDIKVARISASHTALKFVVPVDERATHAPGVP
ncbi:MAG: hypothetical protein V4510_09150 [bacterium]